MTADCIIGLWREPEDVELGRINMNIQKNRMGPAFGTATFALDQATMRIREEAKIQTNDAISSTENTLNNLTVNDLME